MWRIILGVSVFVIAVFSFSVASLFAGQPWFETVRPYAVGGFVAAGVVAWFVGRALGRKNPIPVQEADDDGSDFSIWDLRYWGPMLLVFGVITIFIRPLQRPIESKPVIAAVPKKKAPVAVAMASPPIPVAPVKAPTVFPTLKLQGVLIRNGSSSVIINGESYNVGDHVDGVTVRSIEGERAVVEMDGQTKLLTLD
jgi:hypothetical protein